MFDPSEIALATLSKFIAKSFPKLTLIDEFPYGNEQLSYPSMTISISKSKRTPKIAWVDKTSEPDDDGIVLQNTVVAEWDLNLQLDLWCRDKLERREYVENIIKLFNSQEGGIGIKENSDGLSLKMEDMFCEIARYEIDTVEPMDDEAAAQRQERREKIAVITNFFEIRQKSYYAIRKTVIKSQVATDIAGPSGIESDITL